MFDRSTTLLDYYRRGYRPAKHPGDEHRTTSQTYEIELAKFNQFFRESLAAAGVDARDAALGDLSDELVVGAMSWLVDRGRARTTANKLRRHVNCIGRFASRRGLIAWRPDNERYREDLSEPIALLPEEFQRVLTAAAARRGKIGRTPDNSVPAGAWWLFFCLLAFNVGGRATALFTVPTANLDWHRGELLIAARRQKHRRDQRVRLFVSTLGAATELRLEERGIATLLGDWPYNLETLRRHFTQLLVEAEIFKSADLVPRTLKLHALRKTLASAVAAEHGEHKACDVLQHSSVTVTRRYIDKRYLADPSVPELVADPLPAPPRRPPLRVYASA
jgi:hypothetical protein